MILLQCTSRRYHSCEFSQSNDASFERYHSITNFNSVSAGIIGTPVIIRDLRHDTPPFSTRVIYTFVIIHITHIVPHRYDDYVK